MVFVAIAATKMQQLATTKKTVTHTVSPVCVTVFRLIKSWLTEPPRFFNFGGYLHQRV